MERLLPDPWVCQITPRSLVAFDGGGADGGFYGFVDGVVLVVARHFFSKGFAVAFEDGEVADQVEVAVGGGRCR